MSKFFWRRAFPTVLLVAAFVLLYEATVSDSRYASRQAELLRGNFRAIPGTRLQFKATAYCKGYTTASGVAARSGVAAADPEILPVGSVVQADFESNQYDGIYTVMDTGPEVQGNEIDVYMWSCFDALRFGRQEVHLVVLRLGWNPKDTTPLMETLFHRRIPYVRTDDEPKQPPATASAPRPERIPDGSVAPIPNPTFESTSSAEPESASAPGEALPAAAVPAPADPQPLRP
jgi:3D (Asp-Asp-Asp) domain-containing protein